MDYVDTPLAAQKISVSQPLIRGNFQAANTKFGINHYDFTDKTSNAGKHKVIDFPAYVVTATPTSPASVLYTGAGIQAPADANLLFKNQQSAGVPYVLNCIRGFGSFQGRSTNGACTVVNSSGLSALRTAQGNYNVTINAGLLVAGSSNYLVLVSGNMDATGSVGVIQGYEINSSTSVTLNFKALTGTNTMEDPTFFSVIVIQV